MQNRIARSAARSNNRCIICRRWLVLERANAKNYCSTKCQTLKRPFRIFDGEGRTDESTGKHYLTLLACTDGTTREYIEDYNGLSTAACLEFLTRKRLPCYNVWFSFGYDVNKMLEDIPLRGVFNSREQLWNQGATTWHGYRIDYVPRKTLTITHAASTKQTFHSYDTFGFFQTSFLKACKNWGIDASIIEKGKAERANFSQWTAEAIRDYNFHEMELLLELMNRLRDALYEADVLPQSWHGPGAIASRWLQRENIGDHYAEWPIDMHKPVMHAYFGGRIDISVIGEIDVFKYDIASAYPAAATDCISLSELLEWKHVDEPSIIIDRHALYHVRWDIPREESWGPFPWRNEKGVVLFPQIGEGWYWGVEVNAAMKLFPGCISLLEAWKPIGPKVFPFKEGVERDYAKRAELKAQGKAANVAIKLALNSIYGKTCQHTARKQKRGEKPRWQNYVWGGYITAHARAKILEAFAIVGTKNVVGVATDGLFLRVPLPTAEDVPEGAIATLGTWVDEGHVTLLVVGPGLYATIKGDQQNVYRSRGLPAQINFGYVLREWGCTTKHNTAGADSLGSTKDTFVGMGRALHTDMPCGVFITESRVLKNVTVFGTSKRMPNPFQMGTYDWITFDLWTKPMRKNGQDLPPLMSCAYKWRPEYDGTLDE